MRRIASKLVVAVMGLVVGIAGCSDPNANVQSDLAKLPLPAGVSEKPAVKPFKSRARQSSPPINSESGLPQQAK